MTSPMTLIQNKIKFARLNRIPGSRILISSLPGSASRTHVLRCQREFSKPCLVNLISKDTRLVFSIPSLTLYTLMDSSFLFDIINLGMAWCIVYIEESLVVIT